MSDLCEQFCPAYIACRSRMARVILYSGNLRAFKLELETSAQDHGQDVVTDSVLPRELIDDIVLNNAAYAQIRRSMLALQIARQLCDGPAPSQQGLLIMKDPIIRKNTDEETRQKYIYADATCGDPVGQAILRNLPCV